jgi:hypothetical protein
MHNDNGGTVRADTGSLKPSQKRLPTPYVHGGT